MSWVDTNGSFSGQHHRIKSIAHSAGHVGDFRTRWARRGGHRLQHFRCTDRDHALRQCGASNLVLGCRHHFKRQLHTQVASGGHHTVTHCTDFRNSLQGLWSFDLGNHHHVGANQFTHLLNILRLLNKRKRNHFNRLRPGNSDVAAVLGREQVVGYLGIGHVHALARLQLAPLHNPHFNRVAIHFFNNYFKAAIV